MPQIATTEPEKPAEEKDNRLARLGERLQTSWRALLGTGGADLRKPAELARSWRVDPTLAARVFRAIKESDPLTVLHELPAPNALRGLLTAASRRKVSADLIRDAESAVTQFEQLIHSVGGSKSNLDTIVGSRVRHSRQKIEHSSKQTIFRGFSNLLGVQAHTSLVSYFVFPSDNPDWCNELAVYGYHGLLRLRPELPILFGVRHTITEDKDELAVSLSTLHGDRIVPGGSTTALRPFCTDPLPDIQICEENKRLLYVWPGNPSGLPEEVSLIFASLEQRAECRHRTGQRQSANYNLVPRNPSKHLLLDVFVHKEVWSDVEPELVMLRRGNPQSPRLMAHSLDRLDFLETLDSRGRAISGIPHRQYPGYADLVGYVHQQMDWTLGDFRLYRCAVRYPVVGLWYSVQFQLPSR